MFELWAKKVEGVYCGNRLLEPKVVEVEFFFQCKRFYMRKSRLTDIQIMDAVKCVESGFGVP